jgi:hypothetical protein
MRAVGVDCDLREIIRLKDEYMTHRKSFVEACTTAGMHLRGMRTFVDGKDPFDQHDMKGQITSFNVEPDSGTVTLLLGANEERAERLLRLLKKERIACEKSDELIPADLKNYSSYQLGGHDRFRYIVTAHISNGNELQRCSKSIRALDRQITR